MGARKVTPKTLPLIWLRLTKYVAELQDAPDAAKAFCLDLNSFLDDQASYDAFGTEGQCDPRGDQRN